MEDSAKDDSDCGDAFQEQSGRSTTTSGSQVLPSVGEDASENQPFSGESTETSPALDPPGSSISVPVLEPSGSSLGENPNIGFTSPPPPLYTRMITRSLSKQMSPNPSLERQSVQTDIRRTPVKRKRTEGSSSESGVDKSLGSNLLPSAASVTPDKSRIHEQTRKRRDATPESEESESFSTSPTPSKRKRQRTESSSSDSDASSSRMPDTDGDPEVPTESNIPARDSGESEAEEETSIRARKGSTDLESVDNESDSGELGSKIRTDEECDTLRHGNVEEFGSVSPEESQSAADAFHPGNETQMLASSQPRPLENPRLSSEGLHSGTGTSPPSHIFSNPHLPEQSNASNMNDPRQEFDPKTYDETKKTVGNRSDSLHRTTKPYAKSRLEPSKSLTPVSIEVLHSALDKLAAHDLAEILEDNSDPPLLQKPSDSISSVSSTASRIPSGVEMSLPYLDISEGQPSTSSHQPLVTDDSSAANQFNTSSNVTESGKASKRRTESEISCARIIKFPSIARKHLVKVLGEMMEFNGEDVLFRRFQVLFSDISELSIGRKEHDLSEVLTFYLMSRESLAQSSNLFTPREIQLNYNPREEYESLLSVVVTTLIVIIDVMSSAMYEMYLLNYMKLQNMCRRLTEFRRNYEIESIKDFETFLLLTMNTFQLLFMHIGEHAKQSDINKFEEVLSEEDKMFLRRRIL